MDNVTRFGLHLAGGKHAAKRLLNRALASVLLVLLCAVAGVPASAALALPTYQNVKDHYRASDVLVLDRSNQLLQRVRSDYAGRRGDWLSLNDVSVALQNAIVRSEDQRFYSHAGVDWQAVAAAAWGNVFRQQHRGASTLSMQLVGLIDKQYRRGATGRSLVQKWDQAMAARSLERDWSKSQILEAYLNLVSFRGEIVGVDALARVLFQKHASGLNLRESALAAVLLRSPNVSHGLLTRRTCALLKAMDAPDQCDGLSSFVDVSLLRRSASRADRVDLAMHFARWVLGQEPQAAGASITTSLDIDLQRFVLDTVDRHIHALQVSNVRDAAVVVLDNETGQVLAYVGSSGNWSQADKVDHARALRQAGSTLKPFLYAQAIEQQRLTTVSLLDDSPLNLSTGNGLYIPQNYDQHFSGWVSARTALASSLNIPAVRVLTMVTPDAFQQRLVQLGLPLDRSGDFYGYSLALGSADVTLLSLSNAYRALANQGVYSPVQFLMAPTSMATEKPVNQSVMAAGAAWIIGDVLSDRHARTRTFGLDSPLTTPFWTAVKTGTSKDMRDNWCVGWSQRYTVGVWVGNSGGASMRDVSGVSGAGPIWHDVMAYLHRQQGSHQPPQPALVSRLNVSFQANLEPPREDVFVGDTAISNVVLSGSVSDISPAAARIAQPVSGTILALDPDIPEANQRVWFRAANLAAQTALRVSWQVDKQVIGKGAALAWMPKPGKHLIELVATDGRVLDHAVIEVRGAVSLE